MASAKDVRSLEDSCPWLREDWQARLALLADGTAAAARQYAQDVRVIAELARQVPRCAFDETGSTPWTSFRREVALARKVSDRAAGQLVRAALRLTTVLPRAMGLLEAGVLTVSRADALVSELETVSDELAGLVDAELADKAALLPAWRITQEVRRAVLRLDPEAAAQRTAGKNAGRGVALHPDADNQAVVSLTGPAVPLHRWYATVDSRARALKAAGDPRTLDALRFDLATSTYPCDAHTPTDPTAPPQPNTAGPDSAQPDTAQPDTAQPDTAPEPAADTDGVAVAGLRPGFVEPAPTDCRMSRPVQAHIVLPVETALGLSNEPAWLDGYGWLSAPTSRQLLLDAELRRICAQSSTGALVDLADRDLRPPPPPPGCATACSRWSWAISSSTTPAGAPNPSTTPPTGSGTTSPCATAPATDPPAQVSARRADLDHDTPWPAGPTAAWNLTARARRTHQHKHHGWTPLRTPTSTLWISPAGQTVEVPRHTRPNPGIDPDPTGQPPRLPDPDDLAALDQLQLTPAHDSPPWLPHQERNSTHWTWLTAEPAPF